MLTTTQVQKVQLLILDIIKCEKSLERIRNKLAKDPLFALQPIFRRFDQRKSGYIDRGDLLQFASDNSISICSRESYLLLKWFDKNQDGKVSFEEQILFLMRKYFLSLSVSLLPVESRSRIVTALREPYCMAKKQLLPTSIEEGISCFISVLVEHLKQQSEIKTSLLSDNSFNVFNVFHRIDNKNQGHINLDNLSTFFDRKIKQEDLKYFVQEEKMGCAQFIELFLTAVLPQLDQNFSDQNLTQRSKSQERIRADSFQQLQEPMELSDTQIKNMNFNISNISVKEYSQSNIELQKNVRLLDPLNKDVYHSPFKPLQSKIEIYKDEQYTPSQRKKSSRSQVVTPEKHKEKQQDKSTNYDSTSYKNYVRQIKDHPYQPKNQLNCHILKHMTDHSQNSNSYALFKLFLKFLLASRELEDQKRQLALRQDFNLLDAYRYFDMQGQGMVDSEMMNQAFTCLGLRSTLSNIGLILCQYSKMQDGYLRYSDFSRMILPSNSDYQALLQNRQPSFENSIDALFSQLTLQYFRDLLKAILESEAQFEKYREEICEDKDQLFQQLDQDGKGYLNESDIRNFFQINEVYPTAQELRRIMNRQGD